jgi:hypothetical protein
VLNSLKETLYRHEGSVRRYAEASRNDERVEMERIEVQIDQVRVGLHELHTAADQAGTDTKPVHQLTAAQRKARHTALKEQHEAAKDLVAALFEGICKRSFVDNRVQHFQAQHEILRGEIETSLRELLNSLNSGTQTLDGETSRLQQSIVDGYLKLTDGMRGFYLRDMMIYPILQTDTALTGLQQIRFARISPQDADHFMPGLSARDKLAGETLAHFGGFLKESWRANDVTWGRLDAAEIIIRKLLPDCDPAKRKDLIERAQQEIINEMNRYDMGITKPNGSGEKVAAAECTREDLVGREGITDIPSSDLIQWSVRATYNLGAMVRNTFRDTESRFVPKSVIASLDRGMWVLGTVTVPTVKVLRWFWRKSVLRAALEVALVGAIAIVLWTLFLEEWWLALLDRFGPT